MSDRATERRSRIPPRLLAALALLLAPCVSGAEPADPEVHPACFEPYLAAPPSAASRSPLRIEDCNRRHADKPVVRVNGQTRYERPRGSAGELRGSLAYEQVNGPGDQLAWRLFDHAGGTGVFSYVLTARSEGESRRVLRDIRVHPLGDRCDLGSAWIGRDPDHRPVAAIALTPASLPAVLASPLNALPLPGRDRTRADRAFGARLRTSLKSCPTCCVGEAVYRLTEIGSWTLLDVTLDSLAPFDGANMSGLSSALRAHTEPTEAGLRIDASDIESVQRALVAGHPAPATVRRTQFWLQRLGYYWTAPVDGIPGPRTEAAALAFHSDHANEVEQHGLENALALTGLASTGRRLHPVDETGLDPAFARFRTRLETAVARRDARALVTLSAPDILLGFGGSGGLGDLRRLLDHATTRRTLWRELEAITALGAVRAGPDAFCMPYPSCAPEENGPTHSLIGFDPLHTVVVVRPDARFRRSAEPAATVIRRLDHAVMTRLPADASTPDTVWRVRDADGRVGYIDSADARMLAGPRMEVARGNDGWRIVSLVSGD
jgi:hypothetical protein